jgi:hypothetical protein
VVTDSLHSVTFASIRLDILATGTYTLS